MRAKTKPPAGQTQDSFAAAVAWYGGVELPHLSVYPTLQITFLFVQTNVGSPLGGQRE